MKRGPKEFSWFIYRVTNPIMRDFFMGPKNIFRVKEALLSVLAGDIFGKTPIWNSLRMFKLFYYTANVLQPRRAFRGWQRRRFNIRRVNDPAVARRLTVLELLTRLSPADLPDAGAGRMRAGRRRSRPAGVDVVPALAGTAHFCPSGGVDRNRPA